MKRILVLIMMGVMTFSLSACGDSGSKEKEGKEQAVDADVKTEDENSDGEAEEDEDKEDNKEDNKEDKEDKEEKEEDKDTDIKENISDSKEEEKEPEVEDSREEETNEEDLEDDYDKLENAIAKTVEDAVNALNVEWETLAASIKTYDDYVKNVEKVETFYDKINSESEKLCIQLQEYTVEYAQMIMSSDMSNDDKYDAFNDIEDCIYDDALGDLEDDIYDELYDDMEDALYEGVLDDSDVDSYSNWSKVHSNEYKMWSSTRSDVYSRCSDTRSDVYSFCSDIRSELWDNDVDRAKKTLEKYKKDVEKLKN